MSGVIPQLDEASRRGDRVWTSLFLNQLQFQSAKVRAASSRASVYAASILLSCFVCCGCAGF